MGSLHKLDLENVCLTRARAGILGHNAADTSDAGGDWIRTTEAVDAASNAADDTVAAN